MSVPSSVIHIIAGVPINNSYEHTLYFGTKAEQTSYFLSKKVKTFDKFTYLRPGNVIKVAGDIANARTWNYLMFQNDTGKWYYHFITKVVYLNDSAVELHLDQDVIQTYMFDWQLKPCFIERMHTPTDEFGEHTIPEGLETGPLVCQSSHEINLEDNVILMTLATSYAGKMMGGVFCGLRMWAWDTDEDTINTINSWFENQAEDAEAVVSMWMYPKKLLELERQITTNAGNVYEVSNVNKQIEEVVIDPLRNTNQIDGYTVKNKKVFCYPYTMLYMSNNMGGCAVYHRERFKQGVYVFKVIGAASPDSGLQLVPTDYKRSGYNFEEALSIPPFPTCAWNSDTYKVWLAQNQNQQDLAVRQATIQGIAGVATTVASAVTGNYLGIAGGIATAYNALNQTQQIMAQQRDMAIQPDQARGNHSGNINLTHGRMGYSANFMTITAEYAKNIDQYFSRYGYKVNTVAVPSLHNRERFTFIKTVGSTVTGNLGAEDQLKIQSIFDKGITFWADRDTFGDYLTENNPL